jgi:hypothetical protein
MKRSQVTTFIVLAVALLMIAIIIFSVQSETVPEIEDEVATQNFLGTIDNYVDYCLEATSSDVINILGQQGGYFVLLDELYAVTEYGDIAYWWYEDENWVPTDAEVEEQIELGIMTYIKTCLSEAEAQFSVTTERSPKVEADIHHNFVKLTLDYPVSFNVDGQTTRKESFEYIVDVPLGSVLADGRKIIERQRELGEYIDITNLLLNLTNNVKVARDPNYLTIYLLTPSEDDYAFIFSYKMKPLDIPENLPPVLLNAKNWTNVNIGDTINYIFNATDPEGGAVYFDISDPTFGFINHTSGEFNVIIDESMEGFNIFDIIVFDDSDNEVFENLFIYVNDVGYENEGLMNETE